jgi:sulfur-oxidizing protein SoxZ
MGKARIKLPSTAKKGEVIEIKTLVEHPMESGQRKDAAGQPVPRKILNKLAVTFNGKPVMEMKLHPAIAANPYMSFFARVEDSGTFEFVWTDDDGSTISEKAAITAS